MPEVLMLQNLQETDKDDPLECCCSTFSFADCCNNDN
jgi:hypothetical protein